MSSLDEIMAILRSQQANVQQKQQALTQASAPQREGFRNEGQSGMDVLRRGTPEQRRALMEIGAGLASHKTGMAPAQTIGPSVTRGFDILDEIRGRKRKQGMESASADLGAAKDSRDYGLKIGKLAVDSERPTGGQDPATVAEYKFLQTLSEEERQRFMGLKRSGQVINTPGGGIAIRQPDGSMKTLFTPEQGTSLNAGEAGATEDARGSSQYKTDQTTTGTDRVWSATQAYDLAKNMNETSAQFLQMVENDEVDTGIINSFLYNTFGVGTAELAAMNAEQVETVLQNLQITSLTPVTEKELALVMGMWADIAKQKEPNKGLLKRTITKTERIMKMAEADAKVGLKMVKEYGGESPYNSLIDVNPFAQSILGRPVEGQQAPAGPANKPPPGLTGLELVEWFNKNGNANVGQ